MAMKKTKRKKIPVKRTKKDIYMTEQAERYAEI